MTLRRYLRTCVRTNNSHRLARVEYLRFLASPCKPKNVTIHRTSRWHLQTLGVSPCSEERNDPPDKPVAFADARCQPL